METDAPELAPALLTWVKSFEFRESVNSWKDLQDGQILWKILHTVDPDYFSGDLPEDVSEGIDNWIPRWQNLKHINRVVMTFIRDERGKLQALGKRMNPDLKAIAIDASKKETVELTKAIMLAAMYSPISNQQMVQMMEKLGPKIAIPIATCIGQMETLDHKFSETEVQTDTESDVERSLSPEPDGNSHRSAFRRDPDLEREEKLIKAHATIKQLEQANASLVAELDKTRGRMESQVEELTDLKIQLERGGSSDANKEAMDELRQKLNQEREYIAELESELQLARESTDSQVRELERLKEDADSKQKLRDELQLIRVERDDLLQKSKASENLKKKIQTLQDSDKANSTLREDLESAQAEIKELIKLKERHAVLQRSNDEKTKAIQNGEQQIFDQMTTKKRLDHEVKILTQRCEALKDRQARDQETISELETKVQDIEAFRGRPMAEDEQDLASELASMDKKYQEMQVCRDVSLKWTLLLMRYYRKAKNAELEAENSQLRETRDGNEEADLARKNLQTMQSRFEKLEKQYLDTYQENLGLETTLKDAQDTIEYSRSLLFNGKQQTDSGRSRPYIELRDRFKTENDGRLEAEKKLFEIESQLSNARVQIETANARLFAADRNLDKNRLEVIDELKKSASTEKQISEDENERLLDRVKQLEVELDGERSLLRHALLDRDGLLKEDSSLRMSNELKFVREQLNMLQNDPSQLEEVASRLAKRTEEGREGLLKAETEAAQRGTTISDLETRLHQAEEELAKRLSEPAPPPPPPSASAEETKALHRELALMTSAWYDITSRMQSDAVVVQRRSEVPRSFLNRQRRLILGGSGRTG